MCECECVHLCVRACMHVCVLCVHVCEYFSPYRCIAVILGIRIDNNGVRELHQL